MLIYLLIKPKKIFECFICFLKWFYTFVLLVFVQNAFLCFFKNWFKGCFARSSRLRASHEMCLREIKKLHFLFRTSHYCLAGISLLTLLAKCFLGKNWNFFNFIQRLSRLSCECFATKRFSQKLQCVSRLILRLPNSEKMCIFSFI